VVREKLKTAQSRQKSYADRQRRALTFEIGDDVYLKVSPKKGTQRFGLKGKLAPRYIGLFPIVAKRGEVAYKLNLPPALSKIHDVFHVSQLMKCFRAPSKVVHQFRDLSIQDDLSYPKVPIKILDQAERKTRRKATKFLKV
jgi:hypothetical protein